MRVAIADAASRVGRDPDAVRLVAVTKAVGVEEARILFDLGIVHLGENRIEVAREKILEMGEGPVWHMIGNVQRRKVREVVELFSTVDAVDRLSLGVELEKRCEAAGKTMPIRVEVNVSGEESKHGFRPEELSDALAQLRAMAHLRVEGLMTMAPDTGNPENSRAVFRRLRELAEEHGASELSMGMSNDYVVAVEEGSTEVRIGTALYK